MPKAFIEQVQRELRNPEVSDGAIPFIVGTMLSSSLEAGVVAALRRILLPYLPSAS